MDEAEGTTPARKKYSAIEHAKKSIAPRAELKHWQSKSSTGATTASHLISIHKNKNNNNNSDTSGSPSVVALDGRLFHDNVARVSGSSFEHDVHGDGLPHTPTVLTGLLEEWPAFSNPGITWSLEDLAARTTTNLVSLDGGPSFARMSICRGRVTLAEYQQYCETKGEADDDAAPLYVFDPDILTCTFGNNNNGRSSSLSEEYSTPACFSNDAMACINGTEYRPLPPAWLLVGVKRSGTPIHDHPLTVAWNALLVGCKLWCCLPPDVDESALLLNLQQQQQQEDEQEQDEQQECCTNNNNNNSDNNEHDCTTDDDEHSFDLSAMEWFHRCGTLPESAQIIVQRPGEVVYLPAGWFHVVLNVETSTAISVSLTLRRDLPLVLPLLMESDEAFATFWMDRLIRTTTSTDAATVFLQK
jgi:histone arginine demethylase JMJD6